MKRKIAVYTTVIFFIIVNTSYFWEGKLGGIEVPFFMLLIIVYFVLVFWIISQCYVMVKEQYRDKSRIRTIILVSFVLLTTYLKPNGLVDYERFSGENVLVAGKEGADNCLTTLKLKAKGSFLERTVCSGMSKVTGKYTIRKDTIFFSAVNAGRGKTFFQFGVVKSGQPSDPKDSVMLYLYRHYNDTMSDALRITENKLKSNGEK